MIVSINQPAYLPWLGYFHRIAISDAHIVLDHVQFEKNSFTNRNKIRTPEGWTWLTVPVKTAGKFGQLPINELEIVNEKNWAAKHWSSLRLNYAKAPYFEPHAKVFEGIYTRPWLKLQDLMHETTMYLLDAFAISTPLHFSSQMSVEGKKSDLVLNLCQSLKATTYLSGPQGRDYLREEDFRARGIAVQYDDYHHPVYPQLHPGFEPYMSALDLLFNVGPASRKIIMNAQEQVRP